MTIMVCYNDNRNWNHIGQLVVVKKAMKPRALKNANTNLLLVNYNAQKSSWMNQEIFTARFQNVFVTEVKSYLKYKKIISPPKAFRSPNFSPKIYFITMD